MPRAGQPRSPVRKVNALEPVLISAVVVALAEIGDRTQLLAIVLASRFRKPWPVIAGILVATLANHGLSALFGEAATRIVPLKYIRIVAALIFASLGVWTLYSMMRG